MHRLMVCSAIALLALGTAASAAQVSGVSNTFGIDNTKGGPPDIPSYCGSPYGAGTVLLRGQLHCHSYPDDWAIYDYLGTGPGSTLGKYQSLGYDFLAVTDHNIVSPESVGWQGWAPNSVEITHGWGDTHVIAVGSSQGTTIGMVDYPTTGHIASDTAERVKRVHGRNGLAFVAHPDSSPYNIGVSDLVSVWKQSRPDGLGTWTPWPSTAINSQGTWDRLVYALGTPVWGYVEDDYHPDKLSNSKKGRTWVAVPGSPGEWWGNIKDKLRNGNYYCYYTTSGKWPGGSTPPQMRVTVSNAGSQPVISVNFDRTVNSIEFYGYNWGLFKKLKSPVSGSSDSYQATGREKFVRVMARYEFSGGTLWMTSQPIVINKNGNYSPYFASRVGVLSTSPELILTYVDADDKPIPPPAGYVGDVFDVTTADGQLPPGATLQLSYEEEDISAVGGTQYLAIYRYDDGAGAWAKVGGTVNPGAATIETLITALGRYCISADLPEDTTAPEVLIDNPPYAASVAADTTARATVNDDLGAWRVKFYVNDHLLAEDAFGGDGWSADIAVTDYCAGNWILKAEAEDLAGNTGSVETPIYIASSTPPPTVAISNPSNGAGLAGTVSATGTCGDNVAVASVALKVGGTLAGYATIDGANWTCDIDTTYLVDGSRTLTATVEDYPGNQASASVNVTISNGGASAIGSIRTLADGTAAKFANAVVTAGTDLVTGAFLAESPDRTSGIKVLTDQTVLAGDVVSVSGSVTTQGTEKMLQAYDLSIASHGGALPAPIGISIPKLTGQGLDQIGKNIKVWGVVTSSNAGERWFVIDGGVGYSVKCIVPAGVTVPSTGFAEVVGACAVDAATGGPVVIVRAAGDVRAL